jgi:hypothetical protein
MGSVQRNWSPGEVAFPTAGGHPWKLGVELRKGRSSATGAEQSVGRSTRFARLPYVLRVTRRFHRGHDAAVHPSFSHAHVSLVSVRSGGLRQRERYRNGAFRLEVSTLAGA